ncbi:MAG TPA: fused MFS/spermidine synthase [Caulobacterales bacterium]|nr:fused MFS/spermidine synthase [Caulobacterales bacterium]
MAFEFTRRAWAAGLAAAIGAAASPACAQASRFGRLDRRESQYNTIFVDQQGPYIAMRFGVNQVIFTESLYNPRDPDELPVAYTRYLTTTLAYAPNAAKICEIGLGGGRTASYLHDFVAGAQVTCAELDPEVIQLAQRYFGVRPDARLTLVERDGRIFIRGARDRFDIVLVDAYRGTFVPFHLTTREFYTAVKNKLNPGGVVAQNISPDVLSLDDVTATFKAVFAHVDRYQAEGNVVLVGYDGPAKSAADLNARAAALRTTKPLRYPIPAMVAQRQADVPRGRGRVLTDDFAPVEYQSAITRGNARRQ